MGKSKTSPRIRPLGAKVLVKRLEAEEKTRGGIVLLDSAKEKPQRGTILAVGDGKILDDGKVQTRVSSGDAILTGNGGIHAVTNDGKEDLEMIAMIMCYEAKKT